jgi:hypothetical protein
MPTLNLSRTMRHPDYRATRRSPEPATQLTRGPKDLLRCSHGLPALNVVAQALLPVRLSDGGAGL